MNRPWMPLYVAEYLADTAHLSAAESGAYLHLIMHYWLNGSLPDDDLLLSRIARMKIKEWEKSRPLIQAFFSDGWKHKRVERELSVSEAKYEKRALAGSKGGKARAELQANAKQSPSNASSNAVAKPNQLQLHSPSPEPNGSGAELPSDEADLYRRANVVLGKGSGGLVTKLLKAKRKSVPLARAALEQAATKHDPREYIGAIIRGREREANPQEFWDPGL